MLSRLNIRINSNSNSLPSASKAFAFVATAIATNIIYENGNMCTFFYYSNVEYDEIYRKKQQVFNCYTRSSKKKRVRERGKENGCSEQWSKSKSLYVFFSQHSLWFFPLLLRVMRHAENEQEYFELSIKKSQLFGIKSWIVRNDLFPYLHIFNMSVIFSVFSLISFASSFSFAICSSAAALAPAMILTITKQ